MYMHWKRPFRTLAPIILSTLIVGVLFAFPSLTPHPHEEKVIKWEKDGSKDGSDAHNHRSDRSFGGLGNPQEPYTASKCWDNETYRVDQVGSFDNGHCYVDEKAGSDKIPDYYFVNAAMPAAAKQRVRDAFNTWAAVTSDKPDLITGIAFEETATEANAEIKVYWENQAGANNGGSWLASTRELRLDNSMNWYFDADPKEGQPTGIQNDQWHFYSVVLHESGHAVAFGHGTDNDDLMTPVVGEPPNVAGHRYFTGLDADSIEGVRDLYSQPHRRVAFIIDDTGSMGDEIGFVKQTVTQKVDEFTAKGQDPNYYLTTYKDDVTHYGSTTDPATIKGWVNGLFASGGDDCPEEMLGALNRIAQEAPDSEAWVLTDAGFHGGPAAVAQTIYNLIQARVTLHPIVYSWCFASAASASGAAPSSQQDGGHDPSSTSDQVGPETFERLALETGGHYFLITTGETQAATTILLNEMVTDADLLSVNASATPSAPKVHPVLVDSTTTELNFLLKVSSFGSSTFTYSLRDPSGATVGPSTPGVIITTLGRAVYYQIADPAPGQWSMRVEGPGVYTVSASGNTAINFNYLGDTSLPKGKPSTLLASLVGPVANATFRVLNLDGTVVANVAMFDDGTHGDGSPGDGVYGGAYTPAAAGSYRLGVRGTTTDGTNFDHVATQILRVQSLSIDAPASRGAAPGSARIYDFVITNGSTQADTFDLTASDSRGWADLSTVPASVTIPAGGSQTVRIRVNVPAGATPGTVDETRLLAVSRTDLFINDAASVFTTVDTQIQGLVVSHDGPTALGKPTLFEAAVSAGTSVSYTWDFGDGTTGSGATVTHTYRKPGVYTVRVTATNSINTLTDTVEVVVGAVYLPMVRR